jgi:hypothetical protein
MRRRGEEKDWRRLESAVTMWWICCYLGVGDEMKVEVW